ncbi:hypothetical protein GW17_00034001 [Ensete ventricosum]|nr:hypothetical protein GW17_00034001 [Ensete ventricosum]
MRGTHGCRSGEEEEEEVTLVDCSRFRGGPTTEKHQGKACVVTISRVGGGGRKEGDGDRESEATVARDLKGFEEGARNDTGHRWWATMRLEEDKKCRAMDLMQGGWPLGARVQKGRPTDAEESEGKATIVS